MYFFPESAHFFLCRWDVTRYHYLPENVICRVRIPGPFSRFVEYRLPVCDASHIPADVWTEIIGALWESYSPLAHDQWHIDTNAYSRDARRGLLSLSLVNNMFRSLTLPWLSRTLGPFPSTLAFLSRVATQDPHVMFLSNFVNSLDITHFIQCHKLSYNSNNHNKDLQEASVSALYGSGILLHVAVETFHSLHVLSLSVSLFSPPNLTSIFTLKNLRELILTNELSMKGWPRTPWVRADPFTFGMLSKLRSFTVAVDADSKGVIPIWKFLPLLRRNLNIQRLAKLRLESPTAQALSILLIEGSPYNLEALALSGATAEALFSLPASNLSNLTRLELNRLEGASESLPSQTRLDCFTFPQLERLTSPAFVLYAFSDCPKLIRLDVIAHESDKMVTLHKFPIPTFSKVTSLVLPGKIHRYLNMNVTFPAVRSFICLLDHDDPDVNWYDSDDTSDTDSSSEHGMWHGDCMRRLVLIP
jgi:hypothetical protein